MNSRILGVVFSAAVFAASGAYAAGQDDQSSSQQSQTQQQQPPSSQQGMHEKTITGRVQSYKPGKSITIKESSGKTDTVRLSGKNLTAQVDPQVKVGSEVHVMETTEANGQKMVRVEPSGTTGNAAGAPEQQPQPQQDQNKY